MNQDVHLQSVRMRRRFIAELRLILTVILERLLEPVQSVFHVAIPKCFTEVQAEGGQRHRLPRRLAQAINLYSIDVIILANNVIEANAAGNVSHFGAQVRVLARAKKFSQAGALGFDRKWLAGLEC